MTDEEETRYFVQPDSLDDNDISRQMKQGLPLTLPWGRKVARLGTTFHSRLQSTDNPWSEETPFVLSDLHMMSKELHFENGTASSFKKVATHKECETSDHLTLGFGVGVGLPFLCSASVKGEYDSAVRENKDSDKISLTSSCRAGTIELQRQPRLTRDAIVELKYGGGYDSLCQRYGDYYLAGYRLGGDAGILMSASGNSRSETEVYGITAKVTVLFISGSKKWENEFRNFRSGRQAQLIGYDTLDDMNWREFSAAGDDIKEIQSWAKGGGSKAATDADSLRVATDAIMMRAENLMERVSEVLERHGHRNGDSLTFAQCEELLREGIVVELLLQPISRLRDVIQWRNDKNII